MKILSNFHISPATGCFNSYQRSRWIPFDRERDGIYSKHEQWTYRDSISLNLWWFIVFYVCREHHMPDNTRTWAEEIEGRQR